MEVESGLDTNSKEKNMKIKVNFKPYIPKMRRVNLRKRESDPQVTESNSRKKAFIKVKDISELTEPRPVTKSVESNIIFCDQNDMIQEIGASAPVQPKQNLHEPLDLSRKDVCQQAYSKNDEVLPLDLSIPKTSNNESYFAQNSKILNKGQPQLQPEPVRTQLASQSPYIVIQPFPFVSANAIIPEGSGPYRSMPQHISTTAKKFHGLTGKVSKRRKSGHQSSKDRAKVEEKHDKQAELQQNQQAGHMKVKKLVMTNNGVFCTFRNFLGAKPVKNKQKTSND